MAYIYDLTDTWSAGGTVFNAIKMNVTDSASAVTSKLVSLQTNGTEHFSVTKAGAGYFSGNVGIGVTPLANTRISVRTATVTDTAYYADNGVNSGFKVKFASSLTSILNDFGADLVLGTNDTERMRINAVGNVGIGTSSIPAGRRLAIAGGSVRIDSDQQIEWGGSTVGLYGNSTTNSLTFFTNTTTRATIDSSGQVGIGTTSPGLPLNVSKNGTDSGLGYSNVSKFTDGAGNKGLVIGYDNAAQTTVLTANSSAASSNMAFWTYEAGGSGWGERMRVTAAGDVGIGTTGPSSYGKLAVIGNIATSTDGGTVLTMRANAGATTLGAYNATGSFLSFNTNASGSGETERMRIDSSGQVGIGTSSPSSKLDVNGVITGGNGTIKTVISYLADAGVTGTLSNHPYVFYANNAERMRIDSSGNVAVGTTTSYGGKLTLVPAANPTTASASTNQLAIGEATNNSAYKLNVGYIFTGGGYAGSVQAIGGGVGIPLLLNADGGNVGIGTVSPQQKFVVSNAGAGGIEIIPTGVIQSYNRSGGAYQALNYDASIHAFRIGVSEAMRIDASSNVLVGTTAAGGSGTTIYSAANNSNVGRIDIGKSASGAATAMTFRYGASAVGSITYDNAATAYNTSSDYRLKDIDGPVANSGAYIDALNPVQGSWKADGSRFIGLLAHEVQEVSETPIATGEKDGEEMQAMDYSAPELIANLIAEIQSLRARVAQLEGN